MPRGFREKFSDSTSPKHDELVRKCVSEEGINKIVSSFDIGAKNRFVVGSGSLVPEGTKMELVDTSFTKEIEKIFKSRSGSILGYCDILIKSVSKYVGSYEEKDIVTPSFGSGTTERTAYFHKAYFILVEVKPWMEEKDKLVPPSQGQIIRQLKTYREYISNEAENFVAATKAFSNPEDVDAYSINIFMVLVTDKEIEDTTLFDNEGIKVIVF